MDTSGLSQTALQPASPQAEGIALLWWAMLYSSVVIFVAVMAVLGVGLLRARRNSPQPLSFSASRKLVLIGGLITPLLVGSALVFASLMLDRRLISNLPADALKVRITGHMWWWQIDYLDEKGQVRATTANELHVPVGRPVSIRLRTGDVIHSFWVPELHGKTDLVPGKENRSWFQVSREGVFRGQCAEFCGQQHALMAFTVVGQPEAQFKRWLQHQSRPANPPMTPGQQRGQAVFLSSSCGGCHTIRGTEASGTEGPDLTHFASRQWLAAISRPNNRGHLAGWISDPQSIKPGSFMPQTLLSPQQLEDLLAYLENLE